MSKAKLNPIELAQLLAISCESASRYWRDTWWEYDRAKGCYVEKSAAEFRTELLKLLHEISPRRMDPSGAEYCSCVQRDFVEDGLKSVWSIPSRVDAPFWIGKAQADETSPSRCRSFVAFPGGIVDIDALVAGRSNHVLATTSDYFCLNALDYVYEPAATCPKFEQFLAVITNGDSALQNLLQEWFGYCLVPDVSFHKFLVVIGKGANGKSVLAQVLRGVIGVSNSASLSMSQLCSQFGRSMLVGKLLNISDELSETEKADEELLKTISAGQPVAIDRKFKAMIDGTLPTRLMFTTNSLPHFRDRSDGIWRRLIVVPLTVQISEAEQNRNLVKELLVERPGILNWAIQGLKRLRERGAFTAAAASTQAMDEHRLECNPVREFLDEMVVEAANSDRVPPITVAQLVERYRAWALELGRNDRFGGPAIAKELHRKFPHAKCAQVRVQSGFRIRQYPGLAFVDVVAGAELSARAKASEATASVPTPTKSESVHPLDRALAELQQTPDEVK